jgi:hypothetical protein
MMEAVERLAAGSPWWVVLAASFPSLASGAWMVWRWWTERADRHAAGLLSGEERAVREVEAQRLALSREHADLFDRIRNELIRCQARLGEVERDRERGWDLARYWHRRAHELRHAGLNAQSIVAGLCAREGEPPPDWPDMSVIGLEDARW